MVNENYILQISLIQEEARKLEEQLSIINQQIMEFMSIKESLKYIKEKNKKTLLSLGKGIFVETEIKNKELFVNVGNGVVLKKTIEETKEIINKQLEELERLKNQIVINIEILSLELEKIIEKINENKKIKN
ncbi:MAG: prefoldin subunit alpha [Candidatus Pacearchaeota archaeon]